LMKIAVFELLLGQVEMYSLALADLCKGFKIGIA
jgi:hypothetical protein